MDASIILTSYNNSHNLKKCIDALLGQILCCKKLSLEVIVVDSGSKDNSLNILEQYQNSHKDKVKILTPQKYPLPLSPALARNIGAAEAQGEILIFSDSDCVAPKNWIRSFINNFQDVDIDCVVGSRYPDFGKGLGSFIRRYDFILYSNKNQIKKPILINRETIKQGVPLIMMAANNFAIRRELWQKVGGMKTNFRHPAGEDIMLQIELIKAGYNIVFDPNNKVSHFHPISFNGLFKKFFYNGEATCLLSQYSNNFINWRHFSQRGHIVDIKNFFAKTVFFILFGLALFLLKFSLVQVFFMLLILLLTINFIDFIRIYQCLRKSGTQMGNLYKISIPKLLVFQQIHNLLKITALISFTITKIKLTHELNTNNFRLKTQ